jgi:hypothetical protein
LLLFLKVFVIAINNLACNTMQEYSQIQNEELVMPKYIKQVLMFISLSITMGLTWMLVLEPLLKFHRTVN